MSRPRNAAIWMLCAALMLLACGTDDGDPMDGEGSGAPPADMVGTWTYQSVTVNSAAADLATVLEWATGTAEAHFIVQATSAFVYEEVDASGGQLWAESGFVFVNENENEMDINVQTNSNGNASEMTVVTYTLSGGTLTLQETEPGTTVVFTLTM